MRKHIVSFIVTITFFALLLPVQAAEMPAWGEAYWKEAEAVLARCEESKDGDGTSPYQNNTPVRMGLLDFDLDGTPELWIYFEVSAGNGGCNTLRIWDYANGKVQPVYNANITKTAKDEYEQMLFQDTQSFLYNLEDGSGHGSVGFSLLQDKQSGALSICLEGQMLGGSWKTEEIYHFVGNKDASMAAKLLFSGMVSRDDYTDESKYSVSAYPNTEEVTELEYERKKADATAKWDVLRRLDHQAQSCVLQNQAFASLVSNYKPLAEQVAGSKKQALRSCDSLFLWIGMATMFLNIR